MFSAPTPIRCVVGAAFSTSWSVALCLLTVDHTITKEAFDPFWDGEQCETTGTSASQLPTSQVEEGGACMWSGLLVGSTAGTCNAVLVSPTEWSSVGVCPHAACSNSYTVSHQASAAT